MLLLNGKCLLSNIIYQATIISPSSSNTYIELCETDFKNAYTIIPALLNIEDTEMAQS